MPSPARGMTLGARTLLVNPPLIDGIAFTRLGRCQEREEVLGTTKPPYTLALAAALLRNRGYDIRLVDLTATRQSATDLAARLQKTQLLEHAIVPPELMHQAGRREAVRMMAFASAVAIPLITSIVAPTPAQAASGPPP
jgi:hypothetical protein